ncbi:hypothetical protein [Variovorax sp. YR216]|uniref:hypothetical protein n=1 Tax=Variovorax sp. YR216 TaxID=1882828 RepID=UPI00159F9544
MFPERLSDAVQTARVVLVLIGPDWVAGLNRRAKLPEVDFVRQEVTLSLQRRASTEAAIFPILLSAAVPPPVSAPPPCPGCRRRAGGHRSGGVLGKRAPKTTDKQFAWVYPEAVRAALARVS